MMRFLSVCSGIEAASVAWNPLGWKAAAFSEIEAFPCSVLAHHYPDVPNRGDMTKFESWPDDTVDLLCGGTPCQSFSIAGLRKGLSDPRGNLMLTYLAIATRYRPQWVVWENVPGVLSSWSGADETGALHEGQDEWEGDETSDLSCFLAGLTELGYGWAYRSLDAQFAGLAQRRERVFVVGCLGSRARAGAVLLERHGLSGHPAPRRGARTGVAGTVTTRVGNGSRQVGEYGNLAYGGGNTSGSIDVTTCLTRHGVRMDFDTETFITIPETVGALMTGHSPKGHGAAGTNNQAVAAGHIVPVAWSIMPQNSGRDYKAREVEVLQPLMAGGPVGGNQGGDFIQQAMQVRRLTPRECERLQGFPDDYTLIPHRGTLSKDGPRYKALGNSWAVPCARWIGQRIEAVEALAQLKEAA